MLGFIVAQVAALAQGRKVKKAVVILIMVYVGHGKYNPAAGNGVRLVVNSPAPLAHTPCPVKPYKAAYQFPLRVV
jgi:hypothetical protein